MGWLTRAVGWGVVIYAVMYLVWSGLVIYGLSLGLLSLAIRIITLALITTIAARSLRRADWKDILPFSISWAIVAAILDAVFLVPFSGWELYASWSVWVGYALVAIVPLLTSLFSRRRGAPTNPRLS
ncbi:hypothetical protein A2765_00745 [Candidatus Kaiserbacteria bacterium RIFCSPHIGHO2_01_FULL_56_24]|uniref:Uncharacterized protein n=1 Tax=Candidatus Kaiserbacteria bacterium RIFCSPHIGHO2_01_FULL_56_24 TaxID=1798487 RepID=A0A1F6DEX4_9BACT|nr:MAG: hypothetical protein A2765_00745 [Candidatus Kaiserbacteria bacterium RIFCSPHIGHO2_01_FULL_56_24]